MKVGSALLRRSSSTLRPHQASGARSLLMPMLGASSMCSVTSRAQTARHRLAAVLLGIDDLMGADPLEDQGMQRRVGARHDMRRARFEEEGGGEDVGLHLVADRHDDRVQLVEPELAHQLDVVQRRLHRVGEDVLRLLYGFLAMVDAENLVAAREERLRHRQAEASQPDHRELLQQLVMLEHQHPRLTIDD